jgi:hypothetical protein
VNSSSVRVECPMVKTVSSVSLLKPNPQGTMRLSGYKNQTKQGIFGA